MISTSLIVQIKFEIQAHIQIKKAQQVIIIDSLCITKGRDTGMSYLLAQQSLDLDEKQLKWQIKYNICKI